MLGVRLPRVDVPVAASARGCPPGLSCDPRPGEEPSPPSVRARQPAERSTGVGRSPSVPPGDAQDQASCLLAHSLLVQGCNRCFPSSPASGAGVLRGARQAGPQGAPRAVRGQGCPGVLMSGLGPCRGRQSPEKRLASQELRAGAGSGEGPEEEGLKQRCEQGAQAWRQEGHWGGMGWGVQARCGWGATPSSPASVVSRPQLVQETRSRFPGTGTASGSGKTVRPRRQALSRQLVGPQVGALRALPPPLASAVLPAAGS